MISIATCLWDWNEHSLLTSRCYDESWVEKLAAGFRRNLSKPHRFVVFTDKPRTFADPRIEQVPMASIPEDGKTKFGSFTECFRLNEPTITVGLDTVVVGNCDRYADYCETSDTIALCRDPYHRERSINGVQFIPKGYGHVYDAWADAGSCVNDMEWLRRYECRWIDDLWPGEVLSLKAADVRVRGLGKARIVYMHGKPKAHQLDYAWVARNWRT